jgi:hypothetical protein
VSPLLSSSLDRLTIASDSPANFLHRQDKYSAKTKERIEDIRKDHESRCELWFKPTLSETTNALLLHHRQDLMHETVEERAHRLAYDDLEAINLHKQKKDNEIYGSITFKPAINPLSKELGHKSTLTELHYNPRGRRAKERIKSQIESRESDECSFQPKIDKSQQSYLRHLKMQGKYSQNIFEPPVAWNEFDCPVARVEYGSSARVTADEITRPLGSINMLEPEKMAKDIKLKLQEREEKRQQELIIQEIDELKECTFQPKINSFPRNQTVNQKPIVVKGLGRHLELRNLLQKQKDLEQKRREEAFRVQNIDKYRSSVDGLTIVQVLVKRSAPARLTSPLLLSFSPLPLSL